MKVKSRNRTCSFPFPQIGAGDRGVLARPRIGFPDALGFRSKKGEVIWLFTDLPSTRLSGDAMKRLFRVRWQIELLFKRLKSLLDLKELPTRNGPTARSWLLLLAEQRLN